MYITRFGWIAEKVGMTNLQVENKVQAVTLLKIFRQIVIEKKTEDEQGRVTVGVEKYKLRNKPQICALKKKEKPLCKVIKEFKISADELNSLGDSYGIELFQENMFVDVAAKSIGKGFAGAMKRWNFQGAGASHGNSLAHRAIGSTGTRDKMFKGKKMPGRLGGKRVTIQNLKVCSIDSELGLIVLKGAVPGKNGSIVEVRKAIKKGGVNS